jgi:hypothetical protein
MNRIDREDELRPLREVELPPLPGEPPELPPSSSLPAVRPAEACSCWYWRKRLDDAYFLRNTRCPTMRNPADRQASMNRSALFQP